MSLNFVNAIAPHASSTKNQNQRSIAIKKQLASNTRVSEPPTLNSMGGMMPIQTIQNITNYHIVSSQIVSDDGRSLDLIMDQT